MVTIPERVGDNTELLRKALGKFDFDLRVAMPGIIETFNHEKQTATVNIAIRERLNFNGNLEWKEIPLLLDVPIVIPRAGGYCITFPITKGDECLVRFGECCMDAWWQNGGVQNQVEKRRHDLSDGFAILSCWSQPRVISDYSIDSIQFRNETKSSIVEIKDTTEPDTTTINISTSGTINLITSGTINIGSGDVKINSRVFLDHQHKNAGGTGNSGGVV